MEQTDLQHLPTVVITDSIRRMGEGNVHRGEGEGVPTPWPRYLPQRPGPDGGGGGYPKVPTPPAKVPTPLARSQWGGYPKVHTPRPGPDEGTPRYLPPGQVLMGVPQGTYPQSGPDWGGGGTPRYLSPTPTPGTEQQMEYLILCGQYASCVHAGRLSCCKKAAVNILSSIMFRRVKDTCLSAQSTLQVLLRSNESFTLINIKNCSHMVTIYSNDTVLILILNPFPNSITILVSVFGGVSRCE